MNRISHSCKTFIKILAVFLIYNVNIETVSAETRVPGDFFVFPDLKLSHLSESGQDSNKVDLEPAIDLFYSYQQGGFLALVEYYVNHDENEFERLQLGWAVDQNNRIWLGRFHNPLGVWNADFHHGAYLQTTITRPAIADFEDDSGILPFHVSGVLFEADRYIDDSQFNTSIAFGVGASMESGNLEPFNLFNPGDESYHENISLRLTYYPEASVKRYFGAFAGYNRIEGDAITNREIKQTKLGLFAVYQQPALLWRTSVFYVDNRLSPVTTIPDPKGNFVSAYVQLEYQIDAQWTGFARLEDTFNHENDPYLALIPTFTYQRQLAGVRFDVIPKHALTLEWRQDQRSLGKINQLILQWSAFLP